MRKEALPVMQSSAAVAVRALIMLACVVGIPALALSGTSWSEMLKKLQDFRWPAILNPASASLRRRRRGPAASAHGSATLPQAASAASRVPLSGQPRSGTIGRRSRRLQAGRSAAFRAVATPPATARAAPATADPFHAIQDRLRQLGATYYLLESWGNQQQLYRFYCKMAVGGSADYTRCFEATDAEPLQAMVQVLRQVETWSEGGKQQAEGG